jgi:hypothetical protein
MLISKLSLQVLVVVCVLVTITLDYVKHDKRTQWFKRLRVALYCFTRLKEHGENRVCSRPRWGNCRHVFLP